MLITSNIRYLSWLILFFYVILCNKETVSIKEIKRNMFENAKMEIISELPIKHIIIDCSCINYIDHQGAEAIMNVSLKSKFI